MRPLAVLVALAAVAAACGTASAARTPIVFGVTGGNIVPYSVTIQPNGVIRGHGSARPRRRRLPAATVLRLRRDVQQALLTSRRCGGVIPDAGAQYIHLGGRTWTVRGSCEKRFSRVWSELARAVGLNPA